MRNLWRNIPERGLGAAILLMLGLVASPAAAQKSTFTVTGGAIVFPAPTGTDYANGYVYSATGVSFTIAVNTGIQSRTQTVSIRSTSANMGHGKAITDLEWRRSDLSTWNPIATTDAQVEQRIQIPVVQNDPWGNTIFFRIALRWTTDLPNVYAANYRITLTQTVP